MIEVGTPTAQKRRTWIAYSAIAAVGLTYVVVALLRLFRFDMTGFDAGVFDNVLWRLANGFDDVTALTGAHHFSDHMSILILFAVPIYALVPDLGLPVLMVAQVISVALVAVATWLLADHMELADEKRRAALLVALLGAGVFNAAVNDIHAVGLALGPLALTAALAVRNHRIRTYWIWPALAALARIDLAVSVLIIGLLVRRQHPEHGRVAIALGATSAVAMGLWLFLNPWEGTSFAFHFAHLGIDTPRELPGAVIADPIAALEPLTDSTMWRTVILWFAGFMVLPPLRAARWLLPALPTVIIPVLGSWPAADHARVHYWHVLLPTMAVATVFGLARSPELRDRSFHLAILAVAITWIFMPLFMPSLGNDVGDHRETVAFLQERPNASVAAIGFLVPHITTRESVMQLPTPFACPTLPIAAFRPPEKPPDLVALPGEALERADTDAELALAEVLTSYYTPIADFGRFEVWELARDIPRNAYSARCEFDPAALP